MVTIFKSYGLWTLVEKGITIPNLKKKKLAEELLAKQDDEKMVAILMKDAKALRMIQNAFSDQIFPHIANIDSAKMKANYANQVGVTGNLFYANSTISETGVNGEWYIDSGCSNHMTGDRKLLADIRINVIGKVQMPTGELVNVVGRSNLVIDTSKVRKYIKEVMYLPRLKENLLSVGQMDEHGYYLLFGGKMCSIFDNA
ncbi:PREDICTED: uncharacterized protein LOC107881166 [Prunus mume]|uniref:Uncharacterized protein LOC107881166 n=1 Tax=Prunus mume TaxID=102107 RepID=A0ABM1LQU9_PRUMU|nr:PREDICTED: uncharacterized protein LOC107881166 [Prunus mume]